MNKSRKTELSGTGINLTAFVGIMFAALFLFLIVLWEPAESGLDLKVVDNADCFGPNQDGRYVPVRFRQDGDYVVRLEHVAGPNLKERLASLRGRFDVGCLMIFADRDTPAYRIIEVMDAGRAAGYSHFNVAVEDENADIVVMRPANIPLEDDTLRERALQLGR